MSFLSVILTSNLKVSRVFYRSLSVSSVRTIHPYCTTTGTRLAINPYKTVGHLFYRVALWRSLSSNTVRTQNKLSLCANSHFRTAHYTQQCSISTTPFCHLPNKNQLYDQNRATLKYIIAIAIFVVGLSYAAVPLYRVFCQASGYGGTVILTEASEKVEKMEAVRERELTIKFNADTSAAMLWQFKPQQREIKVVPGETALAFYTAQNTSDKPITGMATYNVVPFEAGLYFNKIQCFCFEEQRLNPNEQVDMPVFFYIDPEFNEDPAVAKVDTITLSYTFFEAKEGENLQTWQTTPP